MKNALSPRRQSFWSRWKALHGTTTRRVRRTPRRGLEALETRALLATITEFPIPSGSGSANQIVAGPDGNLWFTENDPVSNAIGKITPSGQVTEYKIPTAGANPFGITVGPDKNLWFTEEFGDQIGKITPGGQITEFPVGTKAEFPEGIATGPDGNLWFTENLGHSIAKMTTSGQVTQYPLPALSSPVGIINGPNGNLWFTDKGAADAVGQITTSGTITEYKLKSIIADPTGIVLGPGKKDVWITEDFEGHVANVNAQGTVVNDFIVPGNFPQPDGITVGPDGNLWIALKGTREIDEFPPGSAQFTTYALPGTKGQPAGITSGPNNTLWFTDKGNKSIGEIALGSVTTPTPTPTTTPTPTPTSSPPPTPTPTPTPTSTVTSTPTPTPSLLQGFAPPRINTVTTIRKRGRITAIELFFEPKDPALNLASDPLNVADATEVSHYQLVAMTRAKRSHTIIVRPIALASATYSHVTLPASATYGPFEKVTLTLSQPIPKGPRPQLTVFSSTSAIAGVHGIALDGLGNGQPGSNFVATL
jgi:streptogramin lyase